MGRLIIDNTPEPFTKSTCECSLCKEMNDDSYFEVKTNVRKRLLSTIKRIEKRVKKSEPIDIPQPPPYEENSKNSGFWYYN